jgi:hypothetical protein
MGVRLAVTSLDYGVLSDSVSIGISNMEMIWMTIYVKNRRLVLYSRIGVYGEVV